jgi:hypothetical protein
VDSSAGLGALVKRKIPYSYQESMPGHPIQAGRKLTALRLLLLISCLPYSSTLKLEVICSSETWGPLRTTQHYHSKDSTPRIYFRFILILSYTFHFDLQTGRFPRRLHTKIKHNFLFPSSSVHPKFKANLPLFLSTDR